MLLVHWDTKRTIVHDFDQKILYANLEQKSKQKH